MLTWSVGGGGGVRRDSRVEVVLKEVRRGDWMLPGPGGTRSEGVTGGKDDI